METQLKVKLLSHTPEPEKLVATAAKLCYSPVGIEELQQNLTESNVVSFVDKLMEMHHESPVEHVSFTFAVEGVSRALTHQLVRHRIASYSQQSQRYVAAAQFQYIVPPSIKESEYASEVYRQSMENAQESYDIIVDTLISEKAMKYVPETVDCIDAAEYLRDTNPKLYKKLLRECFEDARYLLPNSTETKIILTMNVRSLLGFFNHRCCERAQWEIRELAVKVYEACKEVAPTLFKKAGPSCVSGICPEGSMSCGKQLEKKQIYA